MKNEETTCRPEGEWLHIYGINKDGGPIPAGMLLKVRMEPLNAAEAELFKRAGYLLAVVGPEPRTDSAATGNLLDQLLPAGCLHRIQAIASKGRIPLELPPDQVPECNPPQNQPVSQPPSN